MKALLLWILVGKSKDSVTLTDVGLSGRLEGLELLHWDPGDAAQRAGRAGKHL